MISRKLTFVFLIFGFTINYANAGQWSDYPACETQYDKDVASCNTLPAATNTATKTKREACWSSASNRLATCNGSKGKTLNSPALNK